MGLISSIKSAASKVYNKVKGAVSGDGRQTAIALAGLPTTTKSSGLQVQVGNSDLFAPISKNTNTQTISNLSSGNLSLGNNQPFSSFGGGSPSPTGGASGSWAPTPVNIPAGGSRSNSSTQFVGTQQTNPVTLGVSSPSSLGSMSLAGTPSANQVSVPAAPSYTNPVIDPVALGLNMPPNLKYNQSTRLFEFVQPTETPEDKIAKETKSMYEDLFGRVPERESVLGSSEVRAQQQEVDRRQQELNNYTSQLNNIIAKQNQDLLRLRDIGSREGVTETVYGGQELTINREAAIKALPLQAAVASAQGNLELAQSYLKDVINLRSEQIENTYQYNKDKYNAIREYVTGAQKRKLEILDRDNQRAYEEKKANVNLLGDWSQKTAGYPSIARQIGSLNPESPTFRQELSNIVSSIPAKTQPPTSAVTTEVLDGFTNLSQLTPSQAMKVRSDLYTMGFNSDEVPAWFREYIQNERRASLTPNKLQEEWIKYRDKTLAGANESQAPSSASSEVDFDNL